MVLNEMQYMKRLKNEILVLALFCFVVGLGVLAVAFNHYQQFTKVKKLPVEESTIQTLRELYVNCEFKYAPCIGLVFLFVCLMALRIFLRMRKIENERGN